MSAPGQNYSVQKLVHHPAALAAMRERRHQPPILIHFMPELRCNQACRFCAYQSEDESERVGWKNKVLMVQDHMSREKMLECVADWRAMGVKAVELTGGGEPLVYPHVDEFLRLAAEWGVDLGLVTNGTALTPVRGELLATTNWRWVRVSVDAGSPEGYVATRRVARSHWYLAWRAVEQMAHLKRDPEQRVGVGYVVDASNFDGVYRACELAASFGADNVRVALAFTPQNLARFPAGAVDEAAAQAAQAAKDFPALKVNDLVAERSGNMQLEAQDYQYCAVKEILCVVGGDLNVYTCCSLAFNPKGLVGSIKGQGFRAMWDGPETDALFAEHDARKVCDIPCLYESRNKRALELLEMPPHAVARQAAGDPSIHRNFV